MPSYDFKCKCGDVTEHQVPSTQKTAKCPECGKSAKRLPPCPHAICRYSLMDRGNPRVNRGKGRR